jgi:hypothetical protein
MTCEYPGCAATGCTPARPYCRLHRIWLGWLGR